MSDIIFQYSLASQSNTLWEIGKIAIPSIIAFMAFSVARSQREIASNKYDLDLFNKRLDNYDDFVKEFNNLTTKDEVKIKECIDKFGDNIKIIEKCNVLFSGLSTEANKMKLLYIDYCDCSGILSEISSKREEIDKIQEEMKPLNIKISELQKDIQKFGLSTKEKIIKKVEQSKIIGDRFIIQKKINKIHEENPKMNENEIEYNEKIENIISTMVKNYDVLKEKMIQQLKVSHKPYIPNRFDGLIDFIFGKKGG
ncbi:hypothetical protein [Acetobacter pasteurianus]|uniref:Uncharacterized protein n=1 Tax=Acetobacter pasteurianus subsp. pasteurianus TaxID=481145 RepID=A0A1Y0Y2U0_ACEPA|nr:hypothetical protein [Acetobacter pasteurianus]ARW49513.1 hypothetical protein S1001342_03223 [Acetobacter pasteurianus subsp. pasteurianus]